MRVSDLPACRSTHFVVLLEKCWKGSTVHPDVLRHFPELWVTSVLKSSEKLRFECAYSLSSRFALGESHRPRHNCTLVSGPGLAGYQQRVESPLAFLIT